MSEYDCSLAYRNGPYNKNLDLAAATAASLMEYLSEHHEEFAKEIITKGAGSIEQSRLGPEIFFSMRNGEGELREAVFSKMCELITALSILYVDKCGKPDK